MMHAPPMLASPDHPSKETSGMDTRRLFTLKSLSIMLLLCFLLTAEEILHLVRSRPDHVDDTRTIAFHPGCTPLEVTGRVLRCPVHGYGEMNFLCSEAGCWAKEPSNGLFITPTEQTLFDNHFRHAAENRVK
jgi:hypothetical protein